MAATQHKSCYGTMFPDALHFKIDQPARGRVFSFELDTAAGVGRADRRAMVDIKEWDDCLTCPELEHCYKLCLAKLELEAAIANE